MSRIEQREQRRREILLSGLDLFIRKGYTATKIQDIADAVGMSVGLLFHYFESKEKLYEELVKSGISAPKSMLAGIAGEPILFFETVAWQIFRFFETDLFVAKMFVLMNQAKYNAAAPESVKKLIGDMDYLKISTEKIKQGQQNGTIKDGNPVALAIAFWGAISGIAEEVALGDGSPIPESDWVVDILRRKKSND